MTLLFAAAVVLLMLIYAALLAYAVAQARRRQRSLMLAAALLVGAFAAAMLLRPDVRPLGTLNAGAVTLIAFGGAISAVGVLTFHDLRRESLAHAWGVSGTAWLIVFIAAALISPRAASQAGWLRGGLGLPEAIALIGLLMATISAAVVLLRGAFNADLPEIANRMFYWLMVMGLLVTGAALALSGERLLAPGAHVALAAGAGAALYIGQRHRAFDVRRGLKTAAVALAVMMIGTAVILTVLYVMRSLPLRGGIEQVLILALVALVTSSMFIPIWQGMEWLAAQIIPIKPTDPAHVTHNFSQHVSQAVDLKEIVAAATNTLNAIMGIQRSGLMLVNNTVSLDGYVELLAMQGGSFGSEMKGITANIPLESPLYDQLAVRQQPLTQFEIEYNPRYARISAAERDFLRKQKMHAYAPIIMDTVMIGLLLVGPKVDDTIYTKSDLDVLSTLAQQVGFALRNARLVADLRHLNASMRSLNEGLEEANRELERLDSVKTDFVTIASHELRTPLAQIRGYTDMIDSVNEAGMLEEAQVASMVNNLRKATERMEELIAAMLDVSQIDVNAMDLRFTETTPETILRMAIEPLTNEIRQRKLNLTARWKGLPPIQADLQRMVQAFRNIIVNAIKFTPDGGHIEIVATLQPAKNQHDVNHVLVSIADTGVGIDKENLELIFKKFFRTFDPQLHSTGAYKFLGAGPGLGLTIAKGVIEAHGGRIWAESEYHSIESGPGSTFYVELPVRQQQAEKRAVTFDTENRPPSRSTRS